LGPEKSRSQTCTLSRSKMRPVPPVPCKRKVEACKFLSVQKFAKFLHGEKLALPYGMDPCKRGLTALICIKYLLNVDRLCRGRVYRDE